MMISLEVWKFTSLHVVYDVDDKSLEVWQLTSLHIVSDVDKIGSLEVWKFTYCVMMMILEV